MNKPPVGVGSLAQFDLRQILIIIRAHLVAALAVVVVVCSLVAWQQMRQTKLYSAQATMIVDNSERIADIKQIVDTSFDNEYQINTRLEQMRSSDVAQMVANSLTPEERTLVMRAYYKGPPPIDNPTAVRVAAQRGVKIERRGKTMLIDITVSSQDPKAAALLANRYAEQVPIFIQTRSTKGNERALKFLSDQADQLQKKVEQDANGLQEYRQKYNMVSLENSQNIVSESLKTLSNNATAAKVARLKIEAVLDQAESLIKNNKNLSELAAVAEFSGLTAVQSKIDELQTNRSVMSTRYGAHHPQMLDNERQIKALEKRRDEQIQAALASLRNQLDKAKAEEDQLKAQVDQATKDQLELDKIAVPYDVLRRAADTDQATFTQIKTQLNAATISSQLQPVNIKVSDEAMVPTAPYSPNPRKTFLVTLALGLCILVGYPFTIEMLFSRIRSWADVEYYLGATLLAEVGSVSKIGEGERPHLVEREQDETAAEQFRALYSQLQLSSKIDPPKTILITSTVPGEGKSFVASNLASAFVAHGRKVLLVDADLRRPAQHRSFKLDNKAGVLRWMEEGGTLADDLLHDERLGIIEIAPGLHLLRAGGSSRKASELMESGRLSALIEALQPKFDIVILDTPPAGVFPDAIAFSKVAHELIYICRFNVVSRQQARGVVNRLRQTGLDFLGVVLNDLPAGRGGSYYYYGYGYYHSKYYNKYYEQRKKG